MPTAEVIPAPAEKLESRALSLPEQARAVRGRALTVCPVCATEFAVSAYRLRNGARPCCSRKCMGRKQADERSGEKSDRWRGGRTHNNYGRVLIYTPDHPHADVRGYVQEHVLIAATALGKPLPRGVHVHHFDCTRANNANTNLVICQDAAYHKLLHARQRVKGRGGDPNRHRICSRCKQVLDKDQFYALRNGFDGLSSTCRTCHSESMRAQRRSQAA